MGKRIFKSSSMAYSYQTKVYGGDLASSLSFSRALSSPATFGPNSAAISNAIRRVGFDAPHSRRRFKSLAMSVKRSPKRLKYATPRFTKEDELLYVEVDPSQAGADSWKLDPIVDLLKQGAVGVIPTDTVYAIVCDLSNNSAIERLRRIKNAEPLKPLSILCHSFHDIDTFTTGFPRGDGQGHANLFRSVKHCLPGPYTFILTATKALPKHCIRYGTTDVKYTSRKNVGVRMPDDPICQAILDKFGSPLISTRDGIPPIQWYFTENFSVVSVKSPKENEWMLDPVIIADIYGPEGLDFVVDGGLRVADPSTVVDMTMMPPKIVRQGKGPKLHWMVTEDDHESAESQESSSPISLRR